MKYYSNFKEYINNVTPRKYLINHLEMLKDEVKSIKHEIWLFNDGYYKDEIVDMFKEKEILEFQLQCLNREIKVVNKCLKQLKEAGL